MYRIGQTLTDVSSLPSDLCEATGLQRIQNNSGPSNSMIQPNQGVTVYANGTTHIDPSELAGSITQFDKAMTKVFSIATAMCKDKHNVESHMAFQNGLQDLNTAQHKVRDNLADLETQDPDGIATVRSGLSMQGWSGEKVNSIFGLIKGDLDKELFIVVEEEKAEEWG